MSIEARPFSGEAGHLRMVFQVLRENELYVKKEKRSSAQQSVTFLGH